MEGDSLFPEKECAGGEFLRGGGEEGEQAGKDTDTHAYTQMCILSARPPRPGQKGKERHPDSPRHKTGRNSKVRRETEGGEVDKCSFSAIEKPCSDTPPSIPSRPSPFSKMAATDFFLYATPPSRGALSHPIRSPDYSAGKRCHMEED